MAENQYSDTALMLESLEKGVRETPEDGFRDFAESLIRYIDEVFFWCNPGEVTPFYVSDAFERIWGRPCSSVYARPSSWIASIHPDDLERAKEALQAAESRGRLQVEYRILRPDGEIRWIWMRTFSASSEIHRAAPVIGIAQDVTDRKRAEESRAFLASLVESSDDSIVGTNLEAKIVSWNAAAEQLFGYSTEEIVGQQISSLLPPEAYVDQTSLVDKFRRQERIERFEAVRLGKGGRRIEVAVILSPVWGQDGTLQGVSAIYRDIAERKRAEREREAMEVQLRHAQKLESIGQLAAGIAHEINTPIQYIADNMRFLKDAVADLGQVFARRQAASGQVSATPLEEIREGGASKVDIDYLLDEIPLAIDQSLDGVNRVATLVAAMKEFSHPGTKEKTPVDLNIAIQSTITVSRHEWKYVADLEMDFDSTLPLVTCLPAEVNQVVLNLIVNASHAIAGVNKATGEQGKIVVQTRNCAPWAEIRIRDTGGGIPPAVQDRIFEPFFTTKEVGKGTGQGLAISRSVVVEKHGGSIDFETSSQGTTFIVRLPINP